MFYAIFVVTKKMRMSMTNTDKLRTMMYFFAMDAEVVLEADSFTDLRSFFP
jgi:hypothetical protein